MSSDASALDAAGRCGDGVINPGEACDGTALGGETCVARGWVAGHLVCTGCALDESGCRDTCGGGSEGPCPASQASDDFEDGVIGAPWGEPDMTQGASVEEAGGTLRMTFPANATARAIVNTRSPYDLETYAVTVEVVSSLDPAPSAEATLAVVEPGTGDHAGVGVIDGLVVLYAYLGDVSTWYASAPCDRTTQHYLRLRAMGATLLADMSLDGVLWTNLGAIPAPFPLDNVLLGLQAGLWEPFAELREARFDNFNILPSSAP